MIGILSRPTDVHAIRVVQELSQLGSDSVILDFQSGELVTYSPEQQKTIFRKDGTTFELTAVWIRRPSLPITTMMSSEANHFVRAQWRELLVSLFDNIPSVSNIDVQELATKPVQLRTASRCGLRIPTTQVTNCHRSAIQFIDSHRHKVIFKSLFPPSHRFVPTTLWNDAKHRAELSKSIEVAPVIFQERITGDDVRVTVIGESCFAMQVCNSESIDGRLELDARSKCIALPEDVQKKLILTFKQLQLKFGTVDFKLTKDRSWVFLEINPQGQFLFQEIRTGQPLARCLAKYLVMLAAKNGH